MSDNKNLGRTWFDVFFSFSRKIRIWLFVLIPVIILAAFFFSYWIAEPRETVSLFGVIKIKKSSPTSKPVNSTDSTQLPTLPVKTNKVDQNTNSSNEKIDSTDKVITIKSISPKSPVPVKRHGISVLITDNGRTIDWDLTHKITSMIKKEGGDVVSNPAMTGRFVSSGQFDRAFKGNPIEVVGLGAANPAARLILGKQAMVLSKNSEYNGLITVNASVEIHIISSNKGTIEDSFTISGKGTGYTKADAVRLALENILKNLSTRLLKALPYKNK